MFKYFILLSALLISVCAAWFSVSGISKLFVGASIAAMVMAIALEVGKLVAVSFVYRFWEEIGRALKYYMLVGAIVLSIITSLGIYGYLSAAYATAAVDFSTRQNEVTLLTTQQGSLNTTLESNNSRVRNNDERIQQLQRFRAQQEVRLDSLMGKPGFLTQQGIVRQADVDIRRIQQENRTLEQENRGLLRQRDSLESRKIVQGNAASTDSKIGTFWYISQTLGIPLDSIVKWFVLAIVVVFDPMAVALIVAFNYLVKRDPSKDKKKVEKKEDIYGEKVKLAPKPKKEKKEDDWAPPRISVLKTKPKTVKKSPTPKMIPKETPAPAPHRPEEISVEAPTSIPERPKLEVDIVVPKSTPDSGGPVGIV